MKLTTKTTKTGTVITWTFKKGDVVVVEDIEDINGFIKGFVEAIPGTSGEEFRFLRDLKITVKRDYNRA